MKVEVENLKNFREYPYIGAYKDVLVLFTGNSSGFVINSNVSYELGEYSDTWDEGVFSLFEGKVILQND